MGNSRPPAPVSRKGIGGHGRPSTNLRVLANQFTPEVIKVVAKLMKDKNHAVSLGAAKLHLKLLQFLAKSAAGEAKSRAKKAATQVVKVKITRFKEGDNNA